MCLQVPEMMHQNPEMTYQVIARSRGRILCREGPARWHMGRGTLGAVLGRATAGRWTPARKTDAELLTGQTIQEEGPGAQMSVSEERRSRQARKGMPQTR